MTKQEAMNEMLEYQGMDKSSIRENHFRLREAIGVYRRTKDVEYKEHLMYSYNNILSALNGWNPRSGRYTD